MNSVLTLEENFGEYLKQQIEHSKYEFQTVIHYVLDMKENKIVEINWKNNSHKKGSYRLQIRTTHESL